MKTITNITYPAFALFGLACFALSPKASAQCPQMCDGVTFNTALGIDALVNNATSEDNTAIGFKALEDNTTGSHNTAIGNQALTSNTIAASNTAIGDEALNVNTTGNANTATGQGALSFNTTGGGNTATGVGALMFNTTGSDNTAIGFEALLLNTTGNDNIGVGVSAGRNLTTGKHNIDIGNFGFASDSRRIRIGTVGTQNSTFIAGISGATVPTGAPVLVEANGHLGTITSSARYKDAIKPMDKTSETILALKPVTFRYKHDLDPEGIPQFGLVAEDVEKINPDLVARHEQGKPYTVRYDAVNAMLLNEFLKEHRRVRELEANSARQQKQIEALTAGLQKVSAQLELTKAAPQTVRNE